MGAARMLEHDRKQAGWSVGQAAWRLGVSVREYRELEAGKRSPSFEICDRICNCSSGRKRSCMADLLDEDADSGYSHDA